MNDRLRLAESSDTPTPSFSKRTKKEEVQARFEALWKEKPISFDPMRNNVEQERTERSFATLLKEGSIASKTLLDLGCGEGTFARKCRDATSAVTACDVAEGALSCFRKIDSKDITLTRDYVPHTLFNDNAFDIVTSLDLIAYLQKEDFRLFISELARLVKQEGLVLVSTPLDIHSEDPLYPFLCLMETELIPLQTKLSYHLLLIRLKKFFDVP